MTNKHKSTVTLLTSKGARLAKLWKRDNTVEGYENAKHFKVTEHNVDSIKAFYELLKAKTSDPLTCMVRGKYTGADPNNTLRRISEFEDVPSYLICVDIDKADWDGDIDVFVQDHLPACFQNVSYCWQLTGSHRHPTQKGKLSAHLWYWLSEPHTSAELKQWAKDTNYPFDRALFNPVQIHYLASPVTELGIIDPVKQRCGFVAKDSPCVVLSFEATGAPGKPERQTKHFHDPIARQAEIENVTSETINDLRDAIECLSPERSFDRDEWVNVLQALASLKDTDYEMDAWELAHEFSQQCPEKYSQEDTDRVWNSMEPEIITYKTIFSKAQTDGWRNPKKQELEPDVVIELDDDEPATTNSEAPNADFNTEYPIDWPPGLTGEVARYFFDSARMPVKSYAIAGALSFMSHYNAGMFYVGLSKTALNLYQCLVGDTGTGKEHPRQAIIKLIKAVRHDPLSKVFDDMSSGTGLLRALVQHPRALVMMDELGMTLRGALAVNAPAYQREMMRDLMRLFGQGRSQINGKPYADPKQNIDVIDKPYVNLLGTTTDAELLDGINVKQVNNGFLNRILIVEGAGHLPINRFADNTVPQQLIDDLGNIFNVYNAAWEDEGVALKYEKGAHAHLAQLVDSSRRANDEMRNLWSRVEELTVRTAGILAVGHGQVIRISHIDWAWHYVTHSISRFISIMRERTVDSPFHGLTLQCYEFISKAPEYSTDRQFSVFLKKGLMPKGKLLKLTKAQPKDLTAALDFLLLSCQVEMVNARIKEGKRPTICFKVCGV